MVAVSFPVEIAHHRDNRRATTAWLQVATRPLVEVLTPAPEPGDPVGKDLERAVEEFRARVADVFGAHPSVRIESESNQWSFGDEGEVWSNPIVIESSPRIRGSSQRIVLNGDEFAFPGRWRTYWLHVLLTTVALSASLYWTLRVLVAQPLERLQDGVRLMEMGYWGEVDDATGLWEIRWLSKRFRDMGFRLQRTVEHLAAAERRGVGEMGCNLAQAVPATVPIPLAEASGTADTPSLRSAATLRAGLVARLQKMQRLGGDSEAGRVLAKRVWEEDPPVAERIGDIDLKTRVEDTAFRILAPAEHAALRKKLADSFPDLIAIVEDAENLLTNTLANDGILVNRIEHRIKGLGSIWRKINSKRLTLPLIHDLLAIRVVVQSTEECYRTLHLVHREFSPIVGRFKDYIVDPKPNGYRSIHTSVRIPSGAVCEIQIRSAEMHQIAERGDCAHWRYRLQGQQ